MVAATVHALCETANAFVQNSASEEKLISAARQVAAATAQLLMAVRVRTDLPPELYKRLQVRAYTFYYVFVRVQYTPVMTKFTFH